MSTLLKLISKMDCNLIKSKFKGSLLGSLLGDCLGTPYEGDIITSGDKIIIQRYFDKLETPELQGPIREYTDDTAMMKSVGQALIEKPEIDYEYMAKLFVKRYFKEPNRGYGQNVVHIFTKLRKSKFADIYKPAREQFDGSGSFGNGGAMRIAPIALYFHKNYKLMLEAARKSTEITHTNLLGVHGAILQCIAIHKALISDPKQPLDPQQFCNYLCSEMKEIEKENDDGLGVDETAVPYQRKIEVIRVLLRSSSNEDADEENGTVINLLGNSISAYDSVPTAIYCFLRALKEIPAIETDNIFRRTIQYAITLGGDTDTIACMAGAIAGAYLGDESINKNIVKHCESNEEIVQMAENLYEASKNV